MYCSTAFTLARCNNDVMHNNLKDALEKLISTQYEPEVIPCSSTISQKIKKRQTDHFHKPHQWKTNMQEQC